MNKIALMRFSKKKRYQTLLILWLRTSYRSGSIYIYIYMERNKNLNTHIIFELQSYKLSKSNFYCSKHLPSIVSYYSQKYFTFTKFSGKMKVLQRAYILRVVQAQQRCLSCCILRTTYKNYLSNYIGYIIDDMICLKTVTWFMRHLCHLFQ